MTHNHNHSHDHSHGHGHSHTHSHDHGHSNGHEHDHHAHELTLQQKLETLLGHWIDHNDSHKDTFFTWAKRAEDDGINEAAMDLEKAGELSEQITARLKEALKKLT